MRPTSCRRRGLSAAFVALAIAAVAPAAAGAAHSSTAPGAPGAKALWTPANKQGFGTAMSTQSKVWHTLQGGELTEVYYPDLSTPALRDLQLIVTDGRTFTDRETDATDQHVELVDKHSLTYRQVNTAKSGRYRIVKTYVTDPSRNTLLVDVRFQSLTGRPYQVYAYVDPSLSNDGSDDSGTTSHGALLTQDASAGGALVAEPSFGRTSTGYLDASDGWIDLRDDHRMDWHYRSSPNGNVVQTAQIALDGRRHQHLQLALGFAGTSVAALGTARASLRHGFGRVAGAYADTWHRYLGSLKRPPASTRPFGAEYDESVMVLAAHEGQDLPRRLHRLADHAVGVGDGLRVPQVGRLPRGVVARPLPDRHRDDGGRRPRRRRARAKLRLRQAAAPRRLHPAEHLRRRIAALGRHSAGRGRLPDRPGVAAAPRRRTDLRPARQAGGRLARPDGAPE